MKKTLNFVKGAVSTKDLIPVLTNFHFYNGRVQGGNGRITIDAPLDLRGIDITVPAVPFLRAIDACKGVPQELSFTKNGRLVIKRGKFRSMLPLSNPEDFPLISMDLTGHMLWKPDIDLIAALRTIRPFVGEDASRPWACGALFKDGYIYATNNVVMARIPWDMPDGSMNLPSFAIDELLRINEQPDGFMYCDTYAGFFYGDRWLRSQLFSVEWPDVAMFFESADIDNVPQGLLEAVQKVLPFCPDSKFPTITFNEDGVHTADGDMGASVEGFDLTPSKYRAEPLEMVLSHATHIDLTKYPKPVPFKGVNGLEGVIIGLKQ